MRGTRHRFSQGNPGHFHVCLIGEATKPDDLDFCGAAYLLLSRCRCLSHAFDLRPVLGYCEVVQNHCD